MADPTTRFTGLAQIYATARPTYPTPAIDYIVDKARLKSGCNIADVGAGTGISARLFAQRGLHVNAVEPNADMRLEGESAGTKYGEGDIVYLPTSAEETGLPAQSQELVLAAQAFHWFRPDETLTEFHRILKAGGWVALMWNERDQSDPFTAEYGQSLRINPETEKIETMRQAAGQPLLSSSLYSRGEKQTFSNSQEADLDGVFGRAFSASYAPKDEPTANRLREKLTELFHKYAHDGKVSLKYETSVYLAQKQ